MTRWIIHRKLPVEKNLTFSEEANWLLEKRDVQPKVKPAPKEEPKKINPLAYLYFKPSKSPQQQKLSQLETLLNEEIEELEAEVKNYPQKVRKNRIIQT